MATVPLTLFIIVGDEIMEIKKLNFEKKEVLMKETYIDDNGNARERIKKIMMPTGEVISNDATHCISSEECKE